MTLLSLAFREDSYFRVDLLQKKKREKKKEKKKRKRRIVAISKGEKVKYTAV